MSVRCMYAIEGEKIAEVIMHRLIGPRRGERGKLSVIAFSLRPKETGHRDSSPPQLPNCVHIAFLPETREKSITTKKEEKKDSEARRG